jgi:hypothetical protein
MWFGKYKGRTVSETLDLSPSYIDWCMREVDRFILSESAMESIRKSHPRFRLSSVAIQKQAEKLQAKALADEEQAEAESAAECDDECRSDNLDSFCGDPDDFRYMDMVGEDAIVAWNNTH